MWGRVKTHPVMSTGSRGAPRRNILKQGCCVGPQKGRRMYHRMQRFLILSLHLSTTSVRFLGLGDRTHSAQPAMFIARALSTVITALVVVAPIAVVAAPRAETAPVAERDVLARGPLAAVRPLRHAHQRRPHALRLGERRCTVTIPTAAGMSRVDGLHISHERDRAYIADSQGPIYAAEAGKLGGSAWAAARRRCSP